MVGPVLSNTTPTGPIVDKDGKANFAFIKWMQNAAKVINQGFDPQGNYQGPIGADATINGRHTLASITAKIGTDGVIESDGLPAATPSAQGAVFMPPSAVDNHLGTAAIADSAAFDPSGAAAAAQTAAEAHADTVASTAQSNAEAFASDATNLTSGIIPLARLPGLTVTITTAALTVGGTQGSMDFQNGLLVAQTPAT